MNRRSTHQRRDRPLSVWLLPLCIALAASSAWGQGDASSPPGLTPVDPGRVDVGPFGLSFRQVRLDLRRPLGFDRLFQVTTTEPHSPGVASSPKFARVSGGLTAVFPRSNYVSTPSGTLATVPADTRYVIGDLPQAAAPAPTPSPTAAVHAVESRVQNSADRRADRGANRAAVTQPAVEVVAPAAAASEPQDGMLTSEAYRVARIGQLLAAAAEAR